MNQQELDLLHRHLNGTLTASEMEELESLLLSSSEARKTLRSLATVDEKLRERAAAEEFVMEATPQKNPEWWRQASLVVGGMAAMFVIGLFVWNSGKLPVDNTERGIARIIRLEGTGTINASAQLVNGMEIFSDADLSMEKGLVEIAYRNTGVHMIATAPLDMHLVSDMQLMLTKGEVKLVVPPQGIGFVVETLERKITDLGTSFVVSAKDSGSQVLVLDGQINVDSRDGTPSDLMVEGEIATFARNGKNLMRSNRASGVPELPLAAMDVSNYSLPGRVYGLKKGAFPTKPMKTVISDYVISKHILPLIHSGFSDQSCLEGMVQGMPLRFTGITGTYNRFPQRTQLAPYSIEHGWLAWYKGKVVSPEPGRYRFWGYADNHLLVSINGNPVFEGSRYDSHFRNELEIPRKNHPALPCLNAQAGFASGGWFEIGHEPVRIDLLFGETSKNLTSGLLLIEKEGDSYEKTYWGQPRWPLFLTEYPEPPQQAELEKLRVHMEKRIMGSFSLSQEAVWHVVSDS